MTLSSATDERYARGGGTEFDYNIKLADSHLAAGVTLTVSGALLQANETMILDGSLETNGNLNIFGGRAADTLKGGAQADLLHGNLGADLLTGNGGADIFRYDLTAESQSSTPRSDPRFHSGDRQDRPVADRRQHRRRRRPGLHLDRLERVQPDSGELRALDLNGTGWLLQGDTDGNGSADFVVHAHPVGPTPLSAGDFIL